MAENIPPLNTPNTPEGFEDDTALSPIPIPIEFEYLERLISYRLDHPVGLDIPAMPMVATWSLPVKNFILDHQLGEDQTACTLLLIGLAPHILPNLFENAIHEKLEQAGDFPDIGGTRGKNFRGFLPTGQTALYVLAGRDWEAQLIIQQLFAADHLFAAKKILLLEEPPAGEPAMSGRIILSQDYVETFIYGKPAPPHFSMSFPARLITTELNWNDLVINDELRDQINDLLYWVRYNDRLMNEWGMKDRLVHGYRALFYGPPGTGKTFTAGLIAKEMKKDLYKIDLSMVVSKYIGETEKNLELLFARAEDKGWILFFDEADALFGKRTNVRDAHDKYANQEVSYLLQRMEDFNGLIILATNMKNNIDEAFIRRFSAILKFPLPNPDERSRIWNKAFPEKRTFWKKPPPAEPEPIDIPETVKKYEFSGGSIMNAVHYASLKAVERRDVPANGNEARVTDTRERKSLSPIDPCTDNPNLSIYLSDTLDGIRRELIKEGKPFV